MSVPAGWHCGGGFVCRRKGTTVASDRVLLNYSEEGLQTASYFMQDKDAAQKL